MKSIFTSILAVAITLISIASIADESHHHHEHHAPHDGTLVVLGDEFAHLEFVLDPKTGQMTCYVLDGEAENAVRIEQEQIELQIQDDSKSNESKEFSVVMNPVSNVLTGEKKGDTSEFSAQSDKLNNKEGFDATITEIKVNGVEFKEIEFSFPEGNE